MNIIEITTVETSYAIHFAFISSCKLRNTKINCSLMYFSDYRSNILQHTAASLYNNLINCEYQSKSMWVKVRPKQNIISWKACDTITARQSAFCFVLQLWNVFLYQSWKKSGVPNRSCLEVWVTYIMHHNFLNF